MNLTETGRMPALPRGIAVPVIFTATIFLSAALLFFVQPLYARLILPRIGGAPAVWTTAMLFFQTTLIAGYLYAHLLIRRVPQRGQLAVHLGFWAVALLFLPLSVPPGWSPDPEGSAALQTLGLLALGVGAPFAMLSANAPLLQAWYARSGGPSAADPYFLYGSSNLGSLLALLAFPLVAEPLLGMSAIGQVWAAGFALLGAGLLAAGLCAAGRPAGEAIAAAGAGPGIGRIALWAVIAFVPSSLMLAITTEVSTDMGSLPLIWVVPLALYILSFVVTFRRRPLPARLTRPAALLALAVMAVLVSNQANAMAAWLKALLFAPALLAVAVEAHRELYARRPEAAHLTVFYITMSVGGALGGLANSILAPRLFNAVHEGLVSVALAGLLLVGLSAAPGRRTLRLAVTGGFVALGLLHAWAGGVPLPLPDALVLAAGAALVLGAVLLGRHPLVLAVPAAVFLGLDALAVQGPHLFKDRSFFGAHSVREEDGLRIYTNGTTVHGRQFVAETGRPTPLSYYHPDAPMARIMTSAFGRAAERVGIVGLGVGSLACYARPHQDWAFYEIDAMVDRVAREPTMFRFLSDCTPHAPTHLGDARIVLAGQDTVYDILVLDAYSSDAIPVHLVTREALALYLDRLAPGGMLVFHISNRYYDIRQPLARIAEPLGLAMAIESYVPDPDLAGASASVVVAMAREGAVIDILLEDPRWEPLRSDGGAPWTDDYANLLSALR